MQSFPGKDVHRRKAQRHGLIEMADGRIGRSVTSVAQVPGARESRPCARGGDAA